MVFSQFTPTSPTHRQVTEDALAHLQFLGLAHNPFPVAPDDNNFFISEKIDQILTEIIHGIISRKGFMVLTGDIGLGKTTISRRIMRVLEKQNVQTSLVLHTALQDEELLRAINRDFGLAAGGQRLSDQMAQLNRFVLEQNRAGKNCAIIIDDAQNLSARSLELIRMISNLEADQKKLVQILLIGQPELVVTLDSPGLRQLKSRIIICKQVMPLTFTELNNYLHFKLSAAGSSGRLTLQAAALKKIFRHSRGNLRQANILMDRCLYAAFLAQAAVIDTRIVKTAVQDVQGGHETVAPRRPSRMMWPLAATASVGLVVLLAAMVFQILLASRNGTPARAQKLTMPIVVPAAHASPPVIPVPQRAIAPTAITRPINEFLASYALAAHTEAFTRSLNTGQFESIAATIYRSTGYRLIQLDQVTDRVRRRYGVLVYPDAVTGQARYYLFWRPPLTIEQFYYMYQGPEIKALQQELAAIALYQAKIDGVVGKRLLQAVVAFQKQAGLPVSGRPDAATLFHLYHQQEPQST